MKQNDQIWVNTYCLRMTPDQWAKAQKKQSYSNVLNAPRLVEGMCEWDLIKPNEWAIAKRWLQEAQIECEFQDMSERAAPWISL